MVDLKVEKVRSKRQTWGNLAGASSAKSSAWRRRWGTVKREGPLWLVAGAAFINGLFEILRDLVVPTHYQSGLSWLMPFGIHYWNRSLSLIFGFAMLYLSLNLFRRKRIAW